MNKLVKDVENYVTDFFQKNLPGTYLYHNHLHASRVVDAVIEIGKYYKLSDDDMEVLIIASWFHDIGYVEGPENHEERGCQIAREFLEKQELKNTKIEQIEDCIMATKTSFNPLSQLDKIIRDADNIHLSKKYFLEVSELLRQELKLNDIASYSSREWREKNIEFLTKKHKYLTSYALENWKQKKQKNLLKIFKKNKKSQNKKREAQIKAKFKNESPERGIQTLFRVSLRNHIKLSDIADTKANILLSVNAIIISLALANLIPKLDAPSNTHLMIPSLILVLFSVASIILSIMSTSPKVDKGEFTRENVVNRDVNLLFFGNFHKMAYTEYEWAIDQILDDKKYVYHSLTKDLYLLGKVLKKKYTLLKITYTVFMIGIITSVIAFIIAFSTI